MPYIGHGVTNAGTFYILDDLTMSSSATYTMQVGGVSVTPKADNLLITLDGVVQHTPDAYTVSGSTITFDSAPGSGVDFYGIIMGQSATIGQGSIGADELKVTGDGSSGQVLTSDGDGTFSWATDTENYLPLAGGTVTGDITLSGAKLLVADSAQGIFGANDGDTGIRWETNDVLAFDTQNAERLTIHADGQVKIAGSVANQQLYVEQDNTSNEAVRIIGPAATSATVAVLNVMTNNGASADTGLKVMQNGAVGIGLDTPEAPLHIVNSSNQLRLATDSTSGHAMLSHRSDDKFSIYSWDGSAYTDILLGVDGSSAGGRVGIGTNAPSIGLLDVRYTGGSSDVDTATVLNLKQEASSTTANIRFNTATANSAGHLIFNTDGSFQLRTDGSKYTTFANDGSLTVNVGAPSSANKEIARFQAHADREISFGWIDSGSKMTMYTPGTHSIVIAAGDIGTNHLEISNTGLVHNTTNFASGTNSYVLQASSNNANEFIVNGDDRYYMFNTWQTSWSDRKLKKNITSITNGLDICDKLNPVTFNWKKEWTEGDAKLSTRKFHGIIAQELQEVVPELVYEGKDKLMVQRDELQWVLLAAIKELSAKVKALESE